MVELWSEERVLILGKTYFVASKEHEEFNCTGGILERTNHSQCHRSILLSRAKLPTVYAVPSSPAPRAGCPVRSSRSR